MKKLTLFAATFALAIPAPMAVPAPVLAAANPAVSFCRDYVAAGVDANLNLGECISLLTTENHYYSNGTSGGGFAAHACSYVMQNYPDDFDANYTSYAECVQDGASAFI